MVARAAVADAGGWHYQKRTDKVVNQDKERTKIVILQWTACRGPQRTLSNIGSD